MRVPEAVTLEGRRTRVVPLAADHAAALFEIGQSEEIWTYLSSSPFARAADAEAYVSKLLQMRSDGFRVPFAVFDRNSGSLAGISCYLDIRPAHASVEIGSTWYAKQFQRTHVNTETKLLLLKYAFQDLSANRVAFLTDSRNSRSQQALERIGASKEGVLRSHKIYPDGYVRDSVVYSVIVSDWPAIERHLQGLVDGNLQ